MLVVTVLVYIIFSMSLVSGQKTERNYLRRTRPSHFFQNLIEGVTKPTPTTEKPTSENTVSTEAPIETTTNENKEVFCPPGQSAYTKRDLITIIYFLEDKNKIVQELNNSYYQNAVEVRDKYTENFKIFEDSFEDRPEHLKHILEEMVQTRQRIQPIVTQTESLLSQFATYENSFNSTHENANKFLEHLKNSKEICRLNCDEATMDNTITKTSGRHYTVDQNYCNSFEELTKTIIQTLVKFQTDYGQTLSNKVANDSEILKQKIGDMKNKLKTAAVEQFGMTMYEVLSLQDEYYHFAADIQQCNISNLVQDIKQKNYEINSKLVEMNTMTKKYREYCNTCNNQLAYPVSSTSLEETVAEPNKSTLLDDALQEIMENITKAIDVEYNNIFKDLNQKLNETNIIEAYLSKLKPIQNELVTEIKKETETFEQLQSRVPKASIEKVSELAKKSKELQLNIEDGLTFIREHMTQT